MHLILRYPSGRLADGVLLAAGPSRLRIVVKRLNETIELHLTQGEWVSDRGERIGIEGWLSDGNTAASNLLSQFGRKTSTATH
ncbi:MAG TPA: hypothetical protein VKU19_01125 [Bryobacteraceae bacterium]|nr:hypothetical protein [Bryobacteraceae bacterium]